MGCLYRVSFPNGKAYLGITTQQARSRFKDHCAEARQRFSEKCKGRVITPEARAKMAQAKLGRLPVNAKPVVIDGVLYPSIHGAMRETGLGWDTIKKRMNHANDQQ